MIDILSGGLAAGKFFPVFKFSGGRD